MSRVEDELGEKNLITAFVDLDGKNFSQLHVAPDFGGGLWAPKLTKKRHMIESIL